MAKKRNKNLHLFSILKKSSLTSLIIFLGFMLFKLVEPSISGSTAPTTTHLASSDQPIQFYSNQTQDDLTRLYINTINSAQKSVSLVIFSLLDPQVIQALKDKCDSGVPLNIVCDAKASPGITQRLPKAKIVRRAGKGLTHQKILLVDDKQILIGSSNLTTDSLRVHGNLVIGIENPALAIDLKDKINSMNEDGGSKLLTRRDVTVGSQNVELWVLPDETTAVKRLIQLFRAAKKTIKVAMFTWTRADFTQELIEAAERGVKVETVVDRYSGKGASAKIVHMLAEANIPVRLNKGKGLLHHKFVYIDDEILVNGSANWTQSAFKNNDDCFVVISPLSAEQKAKMNRLWKTLQKESEKPRKG